MFDGTRDNVRATPACRECDTLEREVVGFRPATSEHNLGGPAMQHLRDLPMRVVERLVAVAAQAIDAAGIAERVTEEWQHSGENVRAHGRCRRMVKVNRAIR